MLYNTHSITNSNSKRRQVVSCSISSFVIMMYVVVADARSLYCRATVAYVAPPKTISCVETSNIKKGSLETSEGRKQLQDLYYVGMYVQAEL